MALSASFSVSQEILNPGIIVLTDTSTGSDVNVTSRRIYFTDAEGNYIVPSGTTTDYVEWDYANAEISVDLLTEAKALDIRVDWVNVSNIPLYTSDNLFVFLIFLEQFLYNLTQLQVANPSIAQDRSWYDKKMQLRCEIDGANNAIFYGVDIYACQNCLNRAQQLVNQESVYF